MNPADIIKDAVALIKEYAQELSQKEHRNDVESGELIGYTEALSVLQDACSPDMRREIGVDFDIDAAYLNSTKKKEGLAVMTSMEKKLTENRLTEVKAALSAKYRTVDLGGEKFFVATDGAFFRVGVFPGAMALVIEYADTEQEARQNALEDGDRFYLDETTLDEMLRLMIAEIERC